MEHVVFPSSPLLLELSLKTFILFMQLLLSPLALFVNSIISFITKFVPQFSYLLFKILLHLLFLHPEISLVKFVSLPDILFVPFNNFLDLWLQTLDRLRPNFMNFVLFPFLLSDFFTCLPSLFIFAQFYLKSLILPFLLFFHLSSLFLHRIKHFFNLRT